MLCCLKPAEVPVRVKFYNIADDEKLKFAVIVARSGGRWVFCRHKERSTLEIPGGHREPGDSSTKGRPPNRPPSANSARRPVLRNSP